MAGTPCTLPIPDIEIDLVDLERIIDEDFGGNPENLIMILQAIQKKFNYLPDAALSFLARKLSIPMAQLYTVATFYAMFSLTPKGKHIISICTGTACHLKGSDSVVEALSRKLAVDPGCTTADGLFTLETVNCVGACALAMAAVVDDKYIARTNFKELAARVDQLAADHHQQAAPPPADEPAKAPEAAGG